MLKKTPYFQKPSDRYVTKEGSTRVGVICGVNIKSIKDKTKLKPAGTYTIGSDTRVVKRKWGLFVHIKFDDDSQYDAVWDLSTTRTYSSVNGNPHMDKYVDNRLWECRGIAGVIPAVLYACGVNEFVELIGTKLYVKSNNNAFPAKEGFMISGYDLDTQISYGYFPDAANWIYPDRFDIHEAQA